VAWGGEKPPIGGKKGVGTTVGAGGLDEKDRKRNLKGVRPPNLEEEGKKKKERKKKRILAPDNEGN